MESTERSLRLLEVHLSLAIDGCQDKDCQDVRLEKVPEGLANAHLQEQLCQTTSV